LKKPASLIVLALVCAACEPYGGDLIKSDKARLAASAATEADVRQAARDNAQLGFDLYRGVQGTSGNLFFSPYSISSALGMTYAGARGQTATEMASALRFTLASEQLHPSFNSIDLALHGRSQNSESTLKLNVVNAAWTQKGYEFKQEFLDILAESYGSGIRALDFTRAHEDARKTINNWVSYHTNHRIPELIGQGSLDGSTRLVLTNAVYFNASWKEKFEAVDTTSASFHLLDGSTMNVPTMHNALSVPYVDAEGYKAFELPYSNKDLAMTVILPDSGRFSEIEQQLSVSFLDGVLAGMQETSVILGLPKVKMDSELPLKDLLIARGMVSAFQPGGADFSGMNGRTDLYIDDAIHKAFVSIAEEGTEAAAATAVTVRETSAPIGVDLTVNRPFVFMIRDRPTGTVLFIGRVVTP
jgi:serpin B